MSDENRDDLGDGDVASGLHDRSEQGSMQRAGEFLFLPQGRERRLEIQSSQSKPCPTAEELLAEYERHRAQQQVIGHQPDVAPGVPSVKARPTEISGYRATRASRQVYLPQLPHPATSESEEPVCSLCKDRGYVRADVPFGHPDFGKPIKCQCRKAMDNARLRQAFLDLSLLGHMKRFEHATFQSFKHRIPNVKEAYDAALDFSRDPTGWLTLVGPNGSGKTHLAIALARRCLEQGMSALFSVTPDLLDHLRATFAPNAHEQFDELFQKMKDVEILILDDLGTEQGTSWANDKLFQLVNYRYNMVLPLVVTVNSQAMREMNLRIASRLASGVIVNMVGVADYRVYREKRM
jgi:DNA replication protein DnaC